MKNKLFLKWGTMVTAAMLPLAMITSCEDDLSEDEHYRVPDFLAGNALQVLQKDGQYTTFLKGIELIGYNDVVDSQILTVLAPTDEAFADFLKKKGYGSIEEMYAKDPAYTTQVITYHLLYYAMDWSKMTNFRPVEGDAATESDKARKAGMYNRFRTRCSVPMTRHYNADITVRDTVNVVHYDRYLTVFSEDLFRTLGIDAAANYNYFFPDTKWNPKGLRNGFNVMNAAVLDTAAVVTDNGYLYHIDHVIEPCATIYEMLDKSSNYQVVKTLFDKYGYYQINNLMSDQQGQKIYSHLFDGLPDIALEWASSSSLDFATNSYWSINLFVPTDKALQRMFAEYWEPGCGYASVETLNPLIQRILLLECVGEVKQGTSYESYMCYPQNLRQQACRSGFGTTIDTDPSTFDVNIFCNNGVIYGADNMEVPGVLSSVAGPVFKDVKYLPYLYALSGASQLLPLSSKESSFITLIPDTAQFAHHDPAMRLFTSRASGFEESVLQQWNDENNDYEPLSSSAMERMANMNTTTNATELKTSGVQVIESNASFNYWYVVDGKITTNALFNEQLNPSFNQAIWYPFHEIRRTKAGAAWSNGRAYAYDYPGVFMPAAGNSLEKELSQNNDRNYPYYVFAQLLRLSGLAASGSFAGQLMLDPSNPRFFVFVPTNEVLRDALLTLPGCSKLSINESTMAISGTLSATNKTLLANYLLSYFVTADRNAFRSYPYVGSDCKGNFTTSGSYGINVADNGTSLSVNFTEQGLNKPESGAPVQVVGTYHYLPFAFSDGAFQLLDGILQ